MRSFYTRFSIAERADFSAAGTAKEAAESYDFTGITLIPFCASGSSGIGNSGSNMEELAGTGTWLEGARHSGDISDEDLQAWINGLK